MLEVMPDSMAQAEKQSRTSGMQVYIHKTWVVVFMERSCKRKTNIWIQFSSQKAFRDPFKAWILKLESNGENETNAKFSWRFISYYLLSALGPCLFLSIGTRQDHYEHCIQSFAHAWVTFPSKMIPLLFTTIPHDRKCPFLVYNANENENPFYPFIC